MGFLAPWFLAGALAVGLPVWLHLLRQHKTTPLPFSSLMFFEKRTQSSIKHRRLKYLLLFALRVALLILLALAFAAVLPATLTTVIIAIAISWWPWYVRLIRGQAASVAGRPYIEACRALGIPRRRIILRHILPNSITPLIVQMSLDVGGVILTASALSFLGLGPQDPIPDWGLMVSEGQAYFPTAWWLVTFPGIAILLTAFAFNLLGDGLRDLLDPKRTFL